MLSFLDQNHLQYNTNNAIWTNEAICLPIAKTIYFPLFLFLLQRYKKQKARHRVKNSPTFLCSGISLKYPSVEKLLSFKLFLLIFGAPELARCCVIKQNITTHLALHVLAYSQKSKEFKLCSLTVPSFRELPMLVYPLAVSCRTYVRHLCIDFEISPIWSRWQKRRTVFAIIGIHRQKVMSKRNPAPFEQQCVSVPIEE